MTLRWILLAAGATLTAVLAGPIAGTGPLLASQEAGEPATRIAGDDPDLAAFPQGVAVGEVTPHAALVWTRAPGARALRLEWSKDTDPTADRDEDGRWTRAKRRELEPSGPDHDHALSVAIDGLEPASRYTYRFVDSAGHEAVGHFTTPTAPDQASPVRWVVMGDLGGQGHCRPPGGYEILRHVAAFEPDFVVANGDMIYADGACPATAPDGQPNLPAAFGSVADVDWSTDPEPWETIRAHWRYNRADPAQRALLASTPLFAQWDDHEVINDFGFAWPAWPRDVQRPGWRRLVEAGRATFFDYNPIVPTAGRPDLPPIWRAHRWGAHVDLILLDARSHRSANDAIDGPEKTLLGGEQLAWLKERLLQSTATWKLVSSDVPLTLPTGWESHLYGRDGFASGRASDFSRRTGAEWELLDLLRLLDAENIENVVFVATDVHHALSLRYDLDVDGDGDRLLFHEFISGPLRAVRRPVPAELDPDLPPVVLYGEGDLFNFSTLAIDADGTLRAAVHGPDGEPRVGSVVELSPAGVGEGTSPASAIRPQAER